MNGPLIFPVGHYVGAHFPGAGTDLDFHVLRIGWDIYRLEGNGQFGVWALAHGIPDPDGGRVPPWTRRTLGDAALAAGVGSALTSLDELFGRDLVVEVAPGTAEAIEFARVVRLRSLLAGLGNTADDPVHYGIGVPGGQPVLRASILEYELWKWAHACDSLWHACHVLARAGQDVHSVDPQHTDPARVLDLVLPAVQNLIGHGVAYLDEAREDLLPGGM